MHTPACMTTSTRNCSAWRVHCRRASKTFWKSEEEVSRRGAKIAKKNLLPGSLQRYLFPRPAGAVDGIDDLHCLNSLLAGHHRFTALGDGVAEIQELAFEGLQRNRHRV